MTSRAFVSCLLVASLGLAAAPTRQELSLSGQWECQKVEELTAPPKGGEWKPSTVPGYLRGTDYERVWFRRSFTVPDAMRGKRLKIRFGGVKYNSRVLVNGTRVGGCFGGYQPFEVDVTDAVRLGQPNELAVGVHDWTGIFTPGKVDLGPTREWNRLRGRPRDKILAPIGGLYALYGIWDDVTLVAHPAVYVKDLFVRTSVRRKELVVDYTLANESGAPATVDLDAAIEDEGRDALRLPRMRVRVPAGKTVAVSVKTGWAKPHLWSHVDPYLYHLRTTLSSGDVLRTRFGFREFWVEGHRFFLNGVPVNLLATSWWPPHSPMPREEVESRWRAVKKAGCVAFRTHTQPWRPVHYDVADELGLLMIIEGAVWNDESVYRINDKRFWDNYAKHLRAMVDRDKNRPSVVMWSLENEFYGGRFNDEHPAKADLVRMGRLMKQWDPTRPIFYESDGDPGGVADAIGVHYPHEYPHFTCWPNEAHWLVNAKKIGHMFHNGAKEFVWRKRKPLYIGEFLWLPSSNPSWHTVFFGDDAYTDYRRYRNMGKAESWRMQILGYRHHEVAGISPWTVIEGGKLDESNPLYQAHQHAYQHIAAYCHDYDRRFYAGEEVRRRLEVFNDVLEPSNLHLRWTLTMGGKVLDRGGERLHFTPAEHRLLKVFLRMPKVARRTPLDWRVTVERDGKVVFDDTHHYAAFPRLRLPALAARVGLYDPEKGTRQLFEDNGLRTVPVASLDRLPAGLDVLVIGTGALGAGKPQAPVIGRVAPERAALQGFVVRGGRVLVLGQVAYPEGIFTLGLTKQKSTMTFPLRSGHPALRGVERDDLKFWRGDHMVAANEPARPVAGGAMAIVVSGSAAGIASAPLLERPVGKGCIVHCQLKLVEKFHTEPTAAQILVNLLDHLARYKPTIRKTALVGGNDAYRAYLRSLGLPFDDLTETFTKADLSTYSLIVCRGVKVPSRKMGGGPPSEGLADLVDWAKLRRFVERGGSVLVHRYNEWEGYLNYRPVSEVFGLGLKLIQYWGPVTRAEGDEPLLEAIAREDLYWLGEHKGIGWAETPRSRDMATSMFMKAFAGRRRETHRVHEWALDGKIVERRGQDVVFATTGSASADIDFPVTDRYIIGIMAMGTPCRGVWPVARLSVDETPIGDVSVVSSSFSYVYTVCGRATKGRHKVRVAFINDASDPANKEDRNLSVTRVFIARNGRRDDPVFLTNPPAVACVRRGKGVLVLDQLKWDTEERNARKAARYASSLLTALGGDFMPRMAVAVECEQMTPSDMPHFHKRGTFVSQGCNGYISTKITVAAAGRYTLEVVASGTEADGAYPHLNVRIDGKKVGDVQLTSRAWRPYPVVLDLVEGTHDLALEFDNDRQVPGVADRNVFLDKVRFYRE